MIHFICNKNIVVITKLASLLYSRTKLIAVLIRSRGICSSTNQLPSAVNKVNWYKTQVFDYMNR